MRRFVLEWLGLDTVFDHIALLRGRIDKVSDDMAELRDRVARMEPVVAEGARARMRQQPAEQAQQIKLSIGGKQTSPEPVDDVKGVLLSYGGPRKAHKTKKVNRRSMIDFYERALGGYDVMKHVVLQEHWYTISSDGNGKFCLLIRNRTGVGNWVTRKPRFRTEEAARRAFTEILGIHHMQTTDAYSIWLQAQHRQMRAQ